MLATSLLLLLSATARSAIRGPASRADESALKRVDLTIGGGYAKLVRKDLPDSEGFGLTARAGYALNRAFRLQAIGLWSRHRHARAVEDPTQVTSHVMGLTVGLSYLLDLSPLVPVLDVGLGVIYRGFEHQPSQTDAAGRLGVSLFYRLWRRLLLGVTAAYYGLFTEFEHVPAYVEAGLQLGVTL